MIDYATEDGTAEAGTDYTEASGTVTFAAGETEQTITITVLDDTANEDREDFKVRLSNATDNRIDLPADPARVLIEDDEVTDRQRSAVVQFFGNDQRGRERDGGGHGDGDGLRHGRRRHGLRDRWRGGPDVLLHRGDGTGR